MSEGEAEPEVVESVVSKGNTSNPLGGLQHCDCDDTAAQTQIDRSYPKNDVHPKEDSKDRSYFDHHDIVKAYNEVETLASNRASCIERSSNSCKQEEMQSNHDRNCTQQQHKQRNYDNDNYYADRDQEKYVVYPEEHTYQRKDRPPHSRVLHMETSYDYQTTDETLHREDESSTLENESRVNTKTSNSKSRSFIQMTNLPVEVQESYQQREYEYLKDSTSANKRNTVTPDKREMCVVREYVYQGSDYIIQEEGNFNINRDPCHDKYYNYELQNEKIYQDEVTPSTTQQQSQDQSCIYQPNDGRFYNREEPPTVTSENYQDRSYHYLETNNIPEDKSYVMNKIPHQETNEDKDKFQTESNLLAEEENHYIYEENGPFQRDETSAVDLRILRPLRYSKLPDEIQSSYDSMKEPVIVSHISDDLCLSEHSREKVSPSKTCNDQDTNLSNSSYVIPDQTFYEEEHNNPMEHPRENKSFDYSVCEAAEIENNNAWDAATNTDHTVVEDKESQTGLTEVRDVAVQTDVENKIIPFALFKNIQEEIAKYACPICQRVYISKSSFDRHLRTHEKEKNNVITNVRFTTEAKLQVCKRAVKSKHLKTHKPIIIQVPRSIFQCDMCEKIFPNKREKDNHDCIYKPFPLTKCPECHIKFYTTGALNEHIQIVHKKENAYYCIFCNKSFSAGYNFHLHLDEHLSTH